MFRMIEVTTADEIELATKIINQAFLTVAHEFCFTQDNAPTFPAYIKTDKIENQIKNGLKLFMYEENGKKIGCIGICYTKDLDYFKAERLAVIPEYRHNGIGKQMMGFIEDKVREAHGKSIVVEIVNENVKLKEWYIKSDFYEIRIEKYDHLPFTVSVLEKKL